MLPLIKTRVDCNITAGIFFLYRNYTIPDHFPLIKIMSPIEIISLKIDINGLKKDTNLTSLMPPFNRLAVLIFMKKG